MSYDADTILLGLMVATFVCLYVIELLKGDGDGVKMQTFRA